MRIGHRCGQVQRVAGHDAQVEREMAIGEAAPLLAIQIPERVEGAAVRVPEFFDRRRHAQRSGIETGGAALIGVAADPLIKVDIPDAQRKAGGQNGCQQDQRSAPGERCQLCVYHQRFDRFALLFMSW
jgi:hypothetical protein